MTQIRKHVTTQINWDVVCSPQLITILTLYPLINRHTFWKILSNQMAISLLPPRQHLKTTRGVGMWGRSVAERGPTFPFLKRLTGAEGPPEG